VSACPSAGGRASLLKARALLVEAAGLVGTKAQFTHRAYARARGGAVVSPRDQRAVAFCSAGALMRAEWDLHQTWLERDPWAPLEGPERGRVGPAWMLIAFEQLAIGLFTQFAALSRVRREDGGDDEARRVGSLAVEISWHHDRLDHADVLRGFEVAIANIDTLLADQRRRTGRKRGTRDRETAVTS
jgi:hypothetical protein